MEWRVGDGPLSVGADVAEIQLTNEYVYLEAADLRGLEPLGMFEDATLVVRPAGSPADRVPFWFMAFTWHPLGYVADSDASLDAAAILDVLKRGNEARNEERSRRGLQPIRLTGWFEPPTYDPAQRILRWTEALKGAGSPSILRHARILGRRGFFDVIINGPREDHGALAAETDRLLESFRFRSGNEYTAFDPANDEVSAYDLTSLITANAFVAPGDPGTIRPPMTVGEYVLVDSMRYPNAQAGTAYSYRQTNRLSFNLFVYPGSDRTTVESETASFLSHLENAEGGDFERYRILGSRAWSPVDWADGREVVAELDTEAGMEITYFLVVRARFQFVKIRATVPKGDLSTEGARDLSLDLLSTIAEEQPDVVAFARSEGETLNPTVETFVKLAQSPDDWGDPGEPPASADERPSIRSSFPDARSLTNGAIVNSELSPANPSADEVSMGGDYWFEGDTGDVVRLRVSSPDFYPSLALISADAATAADDGVMAWYAVRAGLGEDAEVSVVLPSSGEYIAQVWAANDSVGRYTIELDIDSGAEDPSSSFEEVLDDGWIKIGDLQQAGTGLYVHGTSSITTDGTVRIWGSAPDGTLQAQNGIEWDMSRYLFEMDCEGKRIREVGIRLYRDGRRVDENPELFESEWRPVEAGIVEETLFGTACR